MRIALLLASLLFAGWVSAGKLERLPQRLITSISAEVTVGADGQLQSIGELSAALDPHMRDLVLAEMRAVQFSPGRLDGRPVSVRTNLSLTLGLRDAAERGNFVLELVDVGTGATMTSRRPPKYPDAMLQQGREAKLMIHLRYDADGRVVDVEIISADLPERHVKRELMRAAHSWRFDPEKVDGVGLAGEAFVPVSFTLDRPTPKFIVRTKSGTRLEFEAEKPREDREAFASALEPQIDEGRVLDIGVAQGGG